MSKTTGREWFNQPVTEFPSVMELKIFHPVLTRLSSVHWALFCNVVFSSHLMTGFADCQYPSGFKKKFKSCVTVIVTFSPITCRLI